MIYYICSDPNFLAHHGVKGMKWGVRRYQNYDGTLTTAGRKHVGIKQNDTRTEVDKKYESATEALNSHIDKYDRLDRDLATGKISQDQYDREWGKLDVEYESLRSEQIDAASKWYDQQTALHKKELNDIAKEYEKLDADLKTAFESGDDEKMMEIFDRMEKLDVATSKIYSYKHDGLFDMSACLVHHGVKGMHWGVRRYQNYDGTRIGVSKTQHYNRNKYNTNVPKTEADAKAQGWDSSVPANAHQRNTKPGKRNVKYVSPDGHREGIYDHKGDLVGGSYNYSSPISNPLGHLVNDVAPYIKYGSNPNDKTTPLKRTEELLGLHGAEKVRQDLASKGQHYIDSIANIEASKVNPGLSMPTPSMHSEKYDPKSFDVRVDPRHTGPNPRKQSLKNTLYGTLSGHYLRNKLNKDLPKNDADAEAKGWRKLSNKDSAMHQFFKEDGVRNSKWVSPDGHREVVFTGKGENQHRTTHTEDAGTYNFFDPKKHPIGHATLDVLPYVLLGNSADDSTTVVTRLSESFKNFKNKEVDSIDTATASIGEEFAKKHKVA